MKKPIKIVSYLKINQFINDFKDKKIVLVGGCFDVFHYGHLQFLKKAKEEGDFLVVALESDEFIRKKKNRQPIHNQKQRAEILSALYFVDLVILLPFFKKEQEYFDLVEKIRPKIIAITNGDSKKENKEKQAVKVGAKLIIVTNLIKNFSTTNILRKIREN